MNIYLNQQSKISLHLKKTDILFLNINKNSKSIQLNFMTVPFWAFPPEPEWF